MRHAVPQHFLQLSRTTSAYQQDHDQNYIKEIACNSQSANLLVSQNIRENNPKHEVFFIQIIEMHVYFSNLQQNLLFEIDNTWACWVMMKYR